jgi:hypothetical protein
LVGIGQLAQHRFEIAQCRQATRRQRTNFDAAVLHHFQERQIERPLEVDQLLERRRRFAVDRLDALLIDPFRRMERAVRLRRIVAHIDVDELGGNLDLCLARLPDGPAGFVIHLDDDQAGVGHFRIDARRHPASYFDRQL